MDGEEIGVYAVEEEGVEHLENDVHGDGGGIIVWCGVSGEVRWAWEDSWKLTLAVLISR